MQSWMEKLIYMPTHNVCVWVNRVEFGYVQQYPQSAAQFSNIVNKIRLSSRDYRWRIVDVTNVYGKWQSEITDCRN